MVPFPDVLRGIAVQRRVNVCGFIQEVRIEDCVDAIG
jgi:hypothetical protein